MDLTQARPVARGASLGMGGVPRWVREPERFTGWSQWVSLMAVVMDEAILSARVGRAGTTNKDDIRE